MSSLAWENFMLEAGDRQLLLESLRPPDGYRFDQGIGTTYTLDLIALMMAPLAFTMFDQGQREDGAAYDSLEVLESLRRYSDRLTLFCQAGRTSIPRAQYPQLAFVEESVIECVSPAGGAFHPKVWALRFVTDAGPVRYRVLCLSRNLVFAQSWDTSLALDGVVQDRARPVPSSRPLAEFVTALPGFATRQPVAPLIAERAASIAAELEMTRFDAPQGFDEVKFWPIGLPNRKPKMPITAGKRLLIVSPFLSNSRLTDLCEDAAEAVLVSTASELGKLASLPASVKKAYVLSDRAQAEADSATGEMVSSVSDAVQLRDLHAKLYVTEDGATARVWTGSANATTAAFERNIEFLVELTGHRKNVGLDMLLTPDSKSVRFINLLTPADNLVGTAPEDPDVVTLERSIDALRGEIACLGLEATVHANGDAFDIGVRLPIRAGLTVPTGLTVKCWPSMIARESGMPLTSGRPGETIASFQKLTRQALTAFFAFEIHGRLNAVEQTAAFVLNLPLIGAPEGRKEDVLRSLLQDRRKLMRFMMLLLAGEGTPLPAFGPDAESAKDSSTSSTAGFSANGLFEMLLRALEEAPHRLDHLESLLTQLRKGKDGQAPLPDDFDSIWEPIIQHRKTALARSSS
jgi:hypothetical protein